MDAITEAVTDHPAQAESIRRIVCRTVAGWGVPEARLRAMHVSDVVRGGAKIGRKFETAGFRAIWLWDRDLIIFWGSDGQVLRTLSASRMLGASEVA